MLKNEVILKFEKYIDETRNFYKITGLSLAIIKNNQIEFAKGYGMLASDSTEIIDKYTYFQAGSIGKTIVCYSNCKNTKRLLVIGITGI